MWECASEIAGHLSWLAKNWATIKAIQQKGEYVIAVEIAKKNIDIDQSH